MDTSSTTTSVSVSMTSAESSCELNFYVSAESCGGPSCPSVWRSEFASSSTMFLAEGYCDEEKGRETRTNTGPSNPLGDGRGYARGGRRASLCHASVASATTLRELESLPVTLSTALTSINANSTSTSYITHPPQDRRASTTALALFHESKIDERKALSSCLRSSNGREGREELVEQRHALHTAGCTRGPDEACSRRLELPQEVFEDGGAECPPHQDVPPKMDSVNSRSSPIDKPYTNCLDQPIEIPNEVDDVYDSFCEDNDFLRNLQRDRRNIILDSPRPDLAPHIVISPPDEPFTGYWAYLANTVDAQSYLRLAVSPRIYGDGGVYIWPPTEDSHFSWHVSPCGRRSGTFDVCAAIPHASYDRPLVFSPSRFQNMVALASEERFLMHHVISPLHRINYKAAVMLASEVAHYFRERWDTPRFAETFEKPFHWTDPAYPLLAEYQSNPYCIVIDSVQPFSVPHIVIEEASLEDPWQAFVNHTVNPQDRRFGFYLTVPASQVEFVNVCPPAEDEDEGDNDHILDGFGNAYISWDSESEPNSPEEPCTPDGELFHQHDDMVEWKGSSHTQFPEPETTISGEKFDPPSPSVDSNVTHITFIDDDDDDDLPPFDDWYLSIAQRAAQSTAV